MKIYLAGPEVFHREAEAIGKAKASLCQQYGHEGLFPLDAGVDGTDLMPHDHGLAIYRADVAMMEACDVIIANVTPFRGPHADPGTAFELGYMRAQAKTCLAYSNMPGLLAARIVSGDEAGRDATGLAIEDFGMADNLMLEGAVTEAGGIHMPEMLSEDDLYWDFRAFEACLKALD